jgi:hypothetical protein
VTISVFPDSITKSEILPGFLTGNLLRRRICLHLLPWLPTHRATLQALHPQASSASPKDSR